VRWYAKRILSKTGSRNQATLVRTITSSLATLYLSDGGRRTDTSKQVGVTIGATKS
jgi:hypothetical protein